MAKKKKINKDQPKTGRRRGRTTDRVAVITELFRLFPTKRYTVKALAAASGGADREGRALTGDIVREMVAHGTVQALGESKYRLNPSAQETMEGIVDMLASGSAYIKVEGEERDIFVDARNAGYALNGDRVKFIISRVKRNGVPEGEIVEIVERSDKGYVGVLEHEKGKSYGFVRVDSRKVPVDIFVRLKDGQKPADNEKVLVRILDWQEGSKSPEGEIVQMFGRSGDNNTEMHAILAEYNLPYEFEQEVLDAAEAIPGEINKKDYIERRDMRAIPTFTIDPADAKDFDDALSIRKLVNGSWEVGVHIADVTHYVKPGSIVDDEGERRATSVYLVD